MTDDEFWNNRFHAIALAVGFVAHAEGWLDDSLRVRAAVYALYETGEWPADADPLPAPDGPAPDKPVARIAGTGYRFGMKHYVGERTPDGVEVLVLDRDAVGGGRPLDPRYDLRRHGDGFEFGFAGSGPAQLSLALLADALGDDDRARLNYQSFKFKQVARWDGDRFEISAEDIRHIVAGLEHDRDRGR